MQLIFEQSVPGRQGFKMPVSDVPAKTQIADRYRRIKECAWPQVSELEVVRHFTKLSQLNFSVDSIFYPLGSCTMKYNPKFTEAVARLPGFADLHPLLAQLSDGESLAQGALKVLYDMDRFLSEITGMDDFTMQPLAGAHGELTGVMLIAAYHKAKGNKKKYIIIPDSAHGTNPASAATAGYDIISIPTKKDGTMDVEILKKKLNPDVAAVMLTCPDTLGIFNSDIDKIAEMVHNVDGLMYYDGANLNAILGRCRPGDLGFDVIHINLHKTFATPHGGGGPGAGPVGVKKRLSKYLPISRVVQRPNKTLFLDYDCPDSIGYTSSFYGNFAVILKAYAYILLLGKDGLTETSNHAVLNANYIMHRLKKYFTVPYERTCMHECVFSAAQQVEKGVHAIDIAKFLIDQGIHPPTVYFPMIVKEAMMVEPTETESKQAMDRFIDCMIKAADLAQRNPSMFKDLPITTPISRPDETKAARDVDCNFFFDTK
ncbi:MAG TPA: aminomethyl-transferring glycine dehydrogenase subunit GcvPB [Candidatus Omnitrophota bacterium]|nr:aminomethyl-transferring glycine dehydrogenase subunit GcvPB [Candidatus Omnitrophota bacterium]HPD85115.1 aminomethyl-transferring glycine dehydrogenase subunit GcvPB [Candidatus Omnitrophota bacterium]HRZ03973.1 aminomethyl-transferring glycine dehydrogenase subunit GcvPB [Candidatus Omnitrophota bacterium]